MCAVHAEGGTQAEPAAYEAAADADYCLLRQDCRFESYSAMHIYGVQPESVTRGTLAREVEPRLLITMSAYGTHRSDILEAPCLVLSRAAQQALDNAGVENISYYPCELRLEYSEQTIGGYSIANVLGLVSCVDPQQSCWEGGEPGNGRLLNFEIDTKRALGLAMFRLAEEPSLVVVSARVRRALEAAQLRGLVFQSTSSYDGYPIDSSRSTPPVGTAEWDEER
jgi:hypothetical protein